MRLAPAIAPIATAINAGLLIDWFQKRAACPAAGFFFLLCDGAKDHGANLSSACTYPHANRQSTKPSNIPNRIAPSVIRFVTRSSTTAVKLARKASKSTFFS